MKWFRALFLACVSSFALSNLPFNNDASHHPAPVAATLNLDGDFLRSELEIDDNALSPSEFRQNPENLSDEEFMGFFNEITSQRPFVARRMPHEPYGVEEDELERSSNIRLLQLEDWQPSMISVNLGRIEINNRHCEAAASVQEQTAQNLVPNTNFLTHCLAFMPREFALSFSHKDIISNSDLITLSYLPKPDRNEDGYRDRSPRGSIFSAPAAWRDTFDFWSNVDTISVHAVGNEGFSSSNDLERSNEYIINLNDTNLRVGAAGYNGNRVFVDRYSSAAAPDVITYNPFQNGFDFPGYYPSREDIIRDTNIQFSNPTNWIGLSDCNPFGIFAFLRPSSDFISQCVINSDKFQSMEEKDRTTIAGTSFTSPTIAGMIGAAKERIEQNHGSSDLLTSHDYWAAAMIAAQPVETARLRNDDDFDYLDLSYVNNGSGLFYNFNLAGFGVLTPDAYFDVIDQMAELRANDIVPETVTNVTHFAKTGLENISASDGNFDYTFTLSGDDNIARMMFVFEFQPPELDGVNDYPETIELISPDGVSITLSPSMENERFELSTVSTNGFLGAAADGEWTIRIKAPHKLNGFEARLVSYEPGSVIDQAIRERTGSSPENATINYAKKKSAQPLRYNN